MQIIGGVFYEEINAKKRAKIRHKAEARPGGGGCRNPVCLCVSFHFPSVSLLINYNVVFLFRCTDSKRCKNRQIQKNRKKDGRFLQIPVIFSGFRRGIGV